MKYVKIIDGQPTDYSVEQLFTDHPDAVIYKRSKMPNEELLANYNVFPLVTTDKPNTNEDSIPEEGTPNKIGDKWYQTWNIRKLTQEEIQSIIEENEASYNNSQELDEDVPFLANSEIQEQRYEICKSCTHLTILKTCKECGCIMPLKTKLSSSKCPLSKW